jgi:hypothetical protein
MIGERIESRPQFPVVATIFLLIAVGLAAAGLALNNFHFLIGAVLPFLVSLALFLKRTPHFLATFTPEGLEVGRSGEFIPYDALQGLKGKGRSSDPRKPGPYSYAIQVIHEEGVLEIPARLNVPSDDVYLFLWERFPPEGSRGVSRPLRDYLREQEAAFGVDRVFPYRARSHLGSWRARQRAAAASLAVAVAGVVWIAVGIPRQAPAWIGFGVMLLLFGLLFFLASLTSGRPAHARIKNWRASGLVISPVGLALVQGDLQGEMRWDELRDLQYRSRPRSFSMTHGTGMAGIDLKFEGASITIVDLYDQPLWVIFDRIRAYWK